MQTYPYNEHHKEWISNASGFLLVCDGENEIIKYARYDVFDMVEPANRLHLEGFLNTASYSDEEKVLGLGHFQLKLKNT